MLFLMLLCFVLKVFGDPPGGFYHPKYDYLDLDAVLNNKRLMYHYANCLLSRAPCPPQGMELKEILPEAIETTCLRCTEKQKAVILHTIKRLKTEYPDIWKEVGDLLDPTGHNLQKLESAFAGTNSESAQQNDTIPNLLANRFGEDESSNELAASLKPTTTTTTLKPTKPKLTPRPVRVPSTSQEFVKTQSVTTKGVTTSTTAPFRFWLNTQGTLWDGTRTRRRPNWLGEVGSKVIQAGTQVAGMVLSTVQAAFGRY